MYTVRLISYINVNIPLRVHLSIDDFASLSYLSLFILHDNSRSIVKKSYPMKTRFVMSLPSDSFRL